MSDDDWRVNAVCARAAPELWFSESRGDQRKAVAFCHSSPVVNECLWDALETRDIDFGIRGALLPEDRRKMLKGMAA